MLLGESGKLYAAELGDTVAEALEDTAHDAVLAAVDLNALLLLVLLVGILACVGLNLTVLQLGAVANLLQVVCGGGLV